MSEPHGFWHSDWSAESAAQGCRDYAELRASRDGVFWSEFDPQQGHTRLWQGGIGLRPRCLTLPGFSLRSRVYEYGGGAFCLGQGEVLFVNEADQQVYRQGLSCTEPQRVSQADDCRYGDLHYNARRQLLLAVEEQRLREQVVHRLVAFDLRAGGRRVLQQGADFYAAPVMCEDGTRLAWVEWMRPGQPWLATCLKQADTDALSEVRTLAGAAGDEAVLQPSFDRQGRLWAVSDRHGYWRPYCLDGGLQPLRGIPHDHATAPWQLGASHYRVADEGLWLMRLQEGFGHLLYRDQAGREQRVAHDFERFRQLAMDDTHVYVIAAAACKPSSILAIERGSGQVQILAEQPCQLAVAEVSRPQAFSYATSGAETAHGFFYPPCNPGYLAQGEKRAPPVLLFLHGGPTSACYPVFDPRIQFWTQRGFAVADLNYRGSSGYGRAYRMRLQGNWGVFDVEDACQAVLHLAAQGWVDARRAFIRGASAGGFSTLCALAFQRVFRAGTSLYGVSNPLDLRKMTHKFEADYLDWLIGDPRLHAQRYAERTPLFHVEHIQAPLLFIQGANDPVVVPQQTRAMVERLEQRGRPVEYLEFADEGHGFRQQDNLALALQRELAFYQRWL